MLNYVNDVMFYDDKWIRVNASNANRLCNVTRLTNLLANDLLDLRVRTKINARISRTMYRCNLSVSMCARIVPHQPNSSITHSCDLSELRYFEFSSLRKYRRTRRSRQFVFVFYVQLAYDLVCFRASSI